MKKMPQQKNKQKGTRRFLGALCAVTAMSLLTAGTVCAEDGIRQDKDGTYIMESGSTAFGMETAGRADSSKIRGDETPNGFENTYGYVPLEYIQLGGGTTLPSNSPNLGAFGTYVFQDGGISASAPATLKKKAFDPKQVYKALAKSVAADLDKDGIDEVAYYYLGNDFNFHLTIFDKVGNVLSTQTLSKYKEPKNAQNKLGVYEYSSFLQIAAGDADGDGQEEISICEPYISSGIPKARIRVYHFNGAKQALKKVAETSEFQLAKKDDFYAPVSLAMGDISGDQRDEVVCSYGDIGSNASAYDYSSSVKVLQYQKGSFKEHSMGTIMADGSPMGCASVTVADVDSDYSNELVVGGYMVNSKDQSRTYKNNATGTSFAYYHELSMAFYEWDHKKDVPVMESKGFTVLRDEDNSAQLPQGNTGFINHKSTDTSLYSGDTESGGQRCFYPGASNWTVPLYSASLSGLRDGTTWDQVFFGSWVYNYDASLKQFTTYHKNDFTQNDSPIGGKVRENNCVIANGEQGSYSRRKVDEASLNMGKEELLITVGKEGTEGATNKKCGWAMFCFTQMQAADGSVTRYGTKMSTLATNTDSTNFEYPSGCVGNINYDITICRLINHIFMYSEPKIIAALAAPPYFEDVGYDTDSSTSFGQSSGSGSEYGGGIDVEYEGGNQVGVSIGVMSAEVAVNYGAGTSYSYATTNSQETSISYATNRAQDSIVMMSTPMDFYNFEVAALKEGVPLEQLTWEPMTMKAPGTAVTSILSKEAYESSRQSYDTYVNAYNAQLTDSSYALRPLPKAADIFQHLQGYPETYRYNSQDYSILFDKGKLIPLGYGDSATSFSLTKSDQYTNSGEGSTSIGASFEFSVGVGGNQVSMSQSFKVTGRSFGSTFDFSGTEYSGTIGSIDRQYENLYKYNTEMMVINENLNQSAFPYITYRVQPESVKALPKKADMDVVMQGAHDAAIKVYLPVARTDSVRVSRYELSRKQSTAGDDQWKILSVFDPVDAETAQEIKDTGLSAATEYDYRIRSVRVTAGGQPVTNDKIVSKKKTGDFANYPVTVKDSTGHSERIFILNKSTGGIFCTSPSLLREEDDLLITAQTNDTAFRVTGWNVSSERPCEYTVQDDGKLLITSWNSALTAEPVWEQKTTQIDLSREGSGTLTMQYKNDKGDQTTTTQDGAGVKTCTVCVRENVQISAAPDDTYIVKGWQYQTGSSNQWIDVKNSDGSNYQGNILAFSPNENKMAVKAVFGEPSVQETAALEAAVPEAAVPEEAAQEAAAQENSLIGTLKAGESGTVTFTNDEGATGTIPDPTTAEIGSVIELPGGGDLEFSTKGFIFGGWKAHDGSLYGANAQFTIRTEQETLTAVYQDIQSPAVKMYVDDICFESATLLINKDLYVSSKCENIKIEAEDNASGNLVVEYATIPILEENVEKLKDLDGQEAKEVLEALKAAQICLEWKPYAVEKGITVNEDQSFYLLARVQDEAGNVAYLKTNRIVRNEDSPVVSFDYQAENIWISQSLPCTILSEDALGITQMLYVMGDGNYQGSPAMTESSHIVLNNLKDGDYYILAFAEDKYGKIGGKAIEIKQDTQVPKVTVSYDKETGKLILHPTVGASGLQKAEVQYLDGEWKDVTATYKDGYQTTGDGMYQVRVTNQAGAAATEAYELKESNGGGGNIPPNTGNPSDPTAGGKGLNSASGQKGAVSTGDSAMPAVMVLLGGLSAVVIMAVRRKGR